MSTLSKSVRQLETLTSHDSDVVSPYSTLAFGLVSPQTGLLAAYVNTYGLLTPPAGTGGAVTQITSTATGVTLNQPQGTITSYASTATAAGIYVPFVVTDAAVGLGDVVEVSIGTYAGTGVPVAFVTNVVAGAFTIVLGNVHASAALNAAVPINFKVVKVVSA